jgi:hypothetical protein
MLYEFITLNREEIIKRCRAKVAARSMPPPSETEINHGVPLFLDQLVEMLQSGLGTVAIDKSAGQHGHDMFLKDFTVSQVVHDYGDVCQTVTDLALETDAPISTEDFRTLNRCLDEAIASAVTIYEREPSRRTPSRRRIVTTNDWRFSSMNCGIWSTPPSSPSRCSSRATSAWAGAPARCWTAVSWDCGI